MLSVWESYNKLSSKSTPILVRFFLIRLWLASAIFPALGASDVIWQPPIFPRFEQLRVVITFSATLCCYSNKCGVRLTKRAVISCCSHWITDLEYLVLFYILQELVRDLEQCFLCLYGHPSISKKAKVWGSLVRSKCFKMYLRATIHFEYALSACLRFTSTLACKSIQPFLERFSCPCFVSLKCYMLTCQSMATVVFIYSLEIANVHLIAGLKTSWFEGKENSFPRDQLLSVLLYSWSLV